MRTRIVESKRVNAAQLRASDANWREHPTFQMKVLQYSLGKGQVAPLVCWVNEDGDLELIDGHARLELASPEDELDVVVLDVDRSEAEEFMLILDPSSSLATSKPEALAELLARVEIQDDSIAQLLQDLAASAGLGRTPFLEPDDLPSKVKARSKLGDLYGLGRHRLLVADATEDSSYDCLLEGLPIPTMLFTDPPWNVSIGQDSNPRHRRRPGLANDDLQDVDYEEFLRSFIAAVSARVSGDSYIVLGSEQWPRLDRVMRDAGYHWSATICWVKDLFVLGRSKFHRRYEPIWYGWKDRSSFNGARNLDDVWEEPRPRASAEHPTMKPVALVARAISASSKAGDVVLDSFAGSGSTLIACEGLKRTCASIEIDPVYADVVIARFEEQTGVQARLL